MALPVRKAAKPSRLTKDFRCDMLAKESEQKREVIPDMEHVLGVLTLAAVAMLLLLYRKNKETAQARGKDSIYAGVWWVTILLFGFALHLFVYLGQAKPAAQGLAAFYAVQVANSLSAAIRMFGFTFNYENVRVVAEGSGLFTFAIITCFLSACTWSIVMAKNVFFRGIANGLKVWLRAHPLPWRGGKACHYILVGCGSQQRMFLRSLTKTVKRKHITIITGAAVPGEPAPQAAYRRLVEEGYAVIHARADADALAKAGINDRSRKKMVVAMTGDDDQNIAVGDVVTRAIFALVFPGESYADTAFLNRAIEALSTRELSDDRLGRLAAAQRMAYAEKLRLKQHITQTQPTLRLGARIVYSVIERAEHFSFAENAYGNVRFVNLHELCARNFFRAHPAPHLAPHLIDTQRARLGGRMENDGKIRKADGTTYRMSNVFVGFGYANFQMLKESILTGQWLGCDYRATIYDGSVSSGGAEQATNTQAIFMNQARGLFPGGDEAEPGETYLESPKELYDIRFRHMDVLSEAFCREIVSAVADDDFTAIYIALGEDKLSLETACEIRQKLYSRRVDISKVSLFVKTRNRSAIADDYVINNPQSIPLRIECFGFDEEILSKAYIVDEKQDAFARAVTNKYHDTIWGFLSELQRMSNRQAAMAIRTKLALLGFDLGPRGPGMEEAMEAYRQQYGLNDPKVRAVLDSGDKLGYLIRDENGEILDTARNNLARLEHLRWDTFHLLNGWTKKPCGRIGAGNMDLPGTDNTGRQNRLMKQHACITTFEGLVALRKIQARKACELDKALSFADAEARADTIWYDFTLMDDLPQRIAALPAEVDMAVTRTMA